VRHSKPVVTPDVPRADWALSHDGRTLAAELGKRLQLQADFHVIASTELKAVQTAELLGAGSVTVDKRLVEIEKPWYDEAQAHAQAVTKYLSGEHLDAWEPQGDALARFTAVIDDHATSSLILVTHGTVLSLWLAQVLSNFDAAAFWSSLTMPDAYSVETGNSVGGLKRR